MSSLSQGEEMENWQAGSLGLLLQPLIPPQEWQEVWMQGKCKSAGDEVAQVGQLLPPFFIQEHEGMEWGSLALGPLRFV